MVHEEYNVGSFTQLLKTLTCDDDSLYFTVKCPYC
jgi:hypothetical protein